jgi:tetratricopeptide (TPR) repeat protein
VLEAMAAPLNATFGYSSPELQHAVERSVALAESLGRRDSMLTGLVALWMSRFVQGRTADGYQAAARALSLVDAYPEQGGSAHFAVGGSALSLGRLVEALRHLELAARLTSGTPSLVGTRSDIHSTAWAAHIHWMLGDDAAARSCCDQAIELARAIEHPYNLAVALAYSAITHQMRRDLPELKESVAELRALCDRYGFAYYREWGLILDGWSRGDESGVGLVRRGIGNLRSQGSFARMPYWLSLLADLYARTGRQDQARATLDAALVAGRARDDLWWLPEVMRLRAAHDDQEPAVSRLRSAMRMASAHGSVALLRRCERELAARGVPPSEGHGADAERSANATGPTFVVP